MPRGSVPWNQRNGGVKTVGGGPAAALRCAAAVRGVRSADVAVPASVSGDKAPNKQQPKADRAATVHLVDTCGCVIDIRPMAKTADGQAAPPQPPPSDEVDGARGGGGTEDDDDRSKQAAAALTGCLSRVQNDLKHIPPGKRSATLPSNVLFSLRVGSELEELICIVWLSKRLVQNTVLSYPVFLL